MKSKTESKSLVSKASIASDLLTSMTGDELRGVAKAIGVPKGKNNKDAIRNLTKAIEAGGLQVKAVFTLSFKPADGSASRVTYFGKTMRTYISGPGQGDETWLTPDQAVGGSPVAPRTQPMPPTSPTSPPRFPAKGKTTTRVPRNCKNGQGPGSNPRALS